MNPNGSQVGDFVQLAIAANGLLTTADGEIAGQINPGGGFTLNSVFQAEYAAGNVASIGDEATVYQLSTQGRNLINAGEPKPGSTGSGASGGPPYDDHHIIAANDVRAMPARNVLGTFGIEVESASNGTWVPRRFHQLYLNNSQPYFNYVNNLLRGAGNKDDALQALQTIKTTIQQKSAAWLQTGAVPTWP